MTALSPSDIDRFGKLLGLLASNHDGERAAAALKATQFLRARALDWADVADLMRPRPAPAYHARPSTEYPYPPTRTGRHRANLLRLSGFPWSDAEKDFLWDVSAESTRLSRKQHEMLRELEQKAAQWVAEGGAK